MMRRTLAAAATLGLLALAAPAHADEFSARIAAPVCAGDGTTTARVVIYGGTGRVSWATYAMTTPTGEIAQAAGSKRLHGPGQRTVLRFTVAESQLMLARVYVGDVTLVSGGLSYRLDCAAVTE